ncbi:sensor histidine kinase [Biostraticola tofi]|uniref:histidine kinase n=1 Tax=Biostraticola tofi TaxID=466109 RepID=A0A4R3Z047_9GAMM|nr:ATP-binding protein [Biostraticola tofi]TCV98296.1 signal transduction histidine kinase [Biostraticola tofi]
MKKSGSRGKRLLIALFLTLLFWGIASWAATSLPETLRLESARFIVSDSATPPDDIGESVKLPDNWRLRTPALNGFAWYRLPFTLDSVPDRPLAVYLPHLSVAGELWLNGSLLTPGVRFGDGARGRPMSDEPLYVVLPSGLFHAGVNELAIRVQGNSAVSSGISALSLGEAETLHDIWFGRYLIQVISPYVILLLMTGSVFFLLAYTWRQRRLFILQLALLLSLLGLMSYLSTMAVGVGTSQGLRIIATTLLFWVLSLAGWRLAAGKWRWFEPLLHATSAVILLITLIYIARGEASDRLWLLTWPHIGLRMLVIGQMCYQGFRLGSAKLWLLAATAFIWNLSIAQSNLVMMDWLQWDSYRLSFIGALPFSLVLIYRLAERFIADHDENRRQQRAAIITERSRILQDMHDGMGAHLITALRLARRQDSSREQLARYIEESLQDLRLIIDSLDLTEQDLLPLLGNLRFRLEPRLQALGIRLEWRVTPLPLLPDLTPDAALSILRIVQEAVNNVIQHAQSSCITLTVIPAGRYIRIVISDDGNGLIPADSHPGSRGLNGMRTRAEKIGAALAINGGASGTQVELLFPITPAALSNR